MQSGVTAAFKVAAGEGRSIHGGVTSSSQGPVRAFKDSVQWSELSAEPSPLKYIDHLNNSGGNDRTKPEPHSAVSLKPVAAPPGVGPTGPSPD